jgi:hypothetical protein
LLVSLALIVCGGENDKTKASLAFRGTEALCGKGESKGNSHWAYFPINP